MKFKIRAQRIGSFTAFSFACPLCTYRLDDYSHAGCGSSASASHRLSLRRGQQDRLQGQGQEGVKHAGTTPSPPSRGCGQDAYRLHPLRGCGRRQDDHIARLLLRTRLRRHHQRVGLHADAQGRLRHHHSQETRWQRLGAATRRHTDPEVSSNGGKITVDSWNNIDKYVR